MAVAVGNEYVEIGGLPLSTAAWRHLKLSDLYNSAGVRGSNQILAYHRGEKPLRKWPTRKRIELPLIVDGGFDSDGNARADSRAGVRQNIEELKTNIRSRISGDGTVQLIYHLAEGGTRQAQVQLNSLMEVDNPEPTSGQVIIDIIVPSGVLEDSTITTRDASDPDSFSVVSTFDAPGLNPRGLAFDGTNLWNADRDSDTIYELNPADGSVISSFASPGSDPNGLTFDGTNLWNADRVDLTIYELDTAGNQVSSFASPGTDPRGMAWDGTNLWNADEDDSVIYKLDTTGTVLDSFSVPISSPEGLTYFNGFLWLGNHDENEIRKIDPSDGSVINVFDGPPNNTVRITGITNDGFHLWAANSNNDVIDKLGADIAISNGDADLLDLDITLSGTATSVRLESKEINSVLDVAVDLSNGDVNVLTETFEVLQGTVDMHGNVVDSGHERWLPIPAGGGTIVASCEPAGSDCTVSIDYRRVWS